MSSPTPISDPPPIRLVVDSWHVLQADASRVRQAVFVLEQGIPLELEWDKWDERSMHCVAYLADEPVGTGRLLPDGHIGRMAVLKAVRGDRVGGRILERLIESGREHGHRGFELSAQQYVASFYRRHGFVQIGESYLEVGIPHVRMRLDDALPPITGLVEREWETKRPDGCGLYQREWLPADGSSAGCIYLLHGLGEHLGRYAVLARRLCSLGWQVRGHDHRGHGRSNGRRGVLSQRDDLLIDAEALLADYRLQTGHKPVLLGHSMGGALAAQLALENQAGLRGLVLSSPALDLGLAILTRMQVFMMNQLAPDLAVPNGINPARLSHDPVMVQAYRNDPLNHDRVTGKLMTWLIEAGRQVMQAAPTLAVPTLLLVAGEDSLVDPQACRVFVEHATNATVNLKWYPDLYHEIFNERAEDRAVVIEDLRAWLAALHR